MRSQLVRRFVVAATSAATTPGAVRADEANLRDAVQLTATAMWLDYKAPALVLAVVRGAEAVEHRFGDTTKTPAASRMAARLTTCSRALPPTVESASQTSAAKSLLDLKLPETGGRQADNAGQSNDSWQYFRF
jgi:hypothetical protein